MKHIIGRSTTGLFMFVAVGAMVLGTALPQAFAGKDGKKFPGWMCRADNSAAAKHVHYHYTGGITNKHTSITYNVVCPILRDSFFVVHRGDSESVKNFKGIERATIYFTDNHPNARLKCTIASRSGHTMKRRDSAFGQSPAGRAASSWFTINGPKKIHPGVYMAEDYFIMRCSIPPKSANGYTILQSYSTLEIDD